MHSSTSSPHSRRTHVPIPGKSAFISDLHLGTPGCRAERLLEFLNRLNVEQLFLVGDIVDLERMQQVVHWPASHTAVMQRVFEMAADGVKVTYIPGNHDARIRAFAGSSFNGIDIRLNTIHTTAAGRRLLVTHGDQFDAELRIGSLKEKIGSAAYQWLLSVDAGVNKVRTRFGYDKVSIASAMKMRIKSAQQYIQQYEQTAVRHAQKRGLDGIVCGHIHKPEIFDVSGVGYFNDGDWVEHCSAILEDENGNLVAWKWSEQEKAASTLQAA